MEREQHSTNEDHNRLACFSISANYVSKLDSLSSRVNHYLFTSLSNALDIWYFVHVGEGLVREGHCGIAGNALQ